MAPRDIDVDDATTVVDSEPGNVTTEHTPLLPTDLPPDVVPSKSFQRLVLCMTFLFLFVIEIAQYMMDAPSTAIMEDILCHQRYPDHVAYYISHSDDPRCKSPQVQKTLAVVKGWIYSADLFVPLLVQIPYGILADKIGRRPVLFLSLFGVTIDVAWQMVVLSFPGIFPVWVVALGALSYLIGGGGPMAAAMLWTIIADATPAAERTRNFYLLHASILGLSVLVKPVAAFLMNFDPWINMWLSFLSVIVATFFTLLIPETIAFRQEADTKRLVDEASEDSTSDAADEATDSSKRNIYESAWNTVKESVVNIWNFILGSRAVLVLLICQVISYIIDSTFSTYLLQYIAGRFDWSWSDAVYISSVNNITALVILLGVLPLTSALLTRKGLGPLSRDLVLARTSIIFGTIGSALIAFAAVPWLFIVSYVIYSCGAGFSPVCRGLLVAIVEPHMLATLNTTISTANSVMGLVLIPAFGWLLGRGFELGGVLDGLPFIVIFGSTMLITVAVFLWRVPAGMDRSPGPQ